VEGCSAFKGIEQDIDVISIIYVSYVYRISDAVTRQKA
jgi:hypothetical protein